MQHPEMRLSGILPDLTEFKDGNLDTTWLARGVLLDRRGIDQDTLSFCKDCFSFIKKGKTPALSLANHLLLGDVPPELRDLTVVEECIIPHCRAKSCIIQLKAEETDTVLPNTQRGMRGHVVIYPQKPEELLNVLPPSLEDVCTPICVVFIGSQRPSQDWLQKHAKPLIVRQERVRAALVWLKAHNILYRNITINEHSLSALPDNGVLPAHVEVINEADAGQILTSCYDAGGSIITNHQQSRTQVRTSP